ncbi:MAG: glycoside hydrolase family 88 protein [Gemmatimonadaceae bacterium]|nr:glycoside hydrolase family 88 protein [Gemmatimonadaceae bacterium]
MQPGGRPLVIPNAVPRRIATTIPWSVRFARSVMTRNPQNHRRWDYTAGVVLGAIDKVGRTRRDSAMLQYVQRNMDRYIAADGAIGGNYSIEEYNIDGVSQGRVLFPLYARSRDVRYRKAADILRKQLATHPRTAEGGFWHKQIYPQQMWLDGLYMAQPFYAEYAATFATPTERATIFDDVAKQFLLVARHTRDAQSNLMYHGWDAVRAQPWADSATGLSRNFWARAMGWYVMGVVETLDHLPITHPDRTMIIRTLQDAADGIARVQDPLTGLWWDVMDAPNREGNYLEASASAMFVYALAKGARLGYLDSKYRQAAERGFDGMIANLVREAPYGASLINVCQVSGLGGNLRKDGSYRDGSYAYYISEPVVSDDYKGVGPMILAALELGR